MSFRLYSGIIFALLPGAVSAAGYYLPNQDAFATARGNAFVATADSAAAVHYNPAGLTQLKGMQAEAGFYSIVLGNEANVGGESYDAKTELQAAPHIYYGMPLNESWSVGFGLNSPFGLGTQWDDDTPFDTVVREARLAYISATGAVAYKINHQLSVGASFSINYADLTLEQGLVPGQPFYLRYEGDDIGFSGGAGVRWQPAEKHAFGLTYHTKSSFDLQGYVSSDVLPDRSGTLDFMSPARAAAGYSYRPSPGWNIEANVEWLDWDSLNTLTLKSETVGGETSIPFEWESSYIYELGVSYTTPGGYVFAAGYDYNESAQPDRHFTPGVSDADRHWLNLGFGHQGNTQSWFIGYQFGFSDRTVTDAEPKASGQSANGEYQARHQALVFSYTRAF